MTSPSRLFGASSLASSNDDRPFLLLDGMSLAFRAYYALSPEIRTSSGLATNALHGFASMLTSLIKSQHPRALAVAFDLPGGTFRDDMTEDYKGGRAETPADLEPQFDLIRALCEVLAIPVLGVPRFEADDVLATLATFGRDHKMPVVVVTGDRDSFQLVEDPYIRVLYNKRGVSDYDLYDEQGIIDRCGIEPGRYPLLAALRGDASDNLPGVPGVGEKTAAKLFATYRDMDELFAHLDDLTPKLRENLTEYEQRARMNERLMTLVRDVPLDVTLEQLHLGGWDWSTVTAFFERFEMNQMRTRFEKLMSEGLLGDPSSEGGAKELDADPVVNIELVQADLEEVLKTRELFVAVVGEWLAVADSGSGHAATGRTDEVVHYLTDHAISGHDLKPLYRRAAELGVTLKDPRDDSAIMAYLVDAVAGRYDLAEVASRYLGTIANPASPSLFDDHVTSEAQAFEDVGMAVSLVRALSAEIDRWELGSIYRSIELPLVAVLGRMEAVGICVDSALLRAITAEFAEEAASLDTSIQDIAGHPFKVNSPTQLQKVLFEELGLTPSKKIKSGFSTDATSLEAIEHEHEIVPLILRYREVEKLRSTYGTSLIDTVASDGRIHATFSQTTARTGRLSSENPNLHNIPVRSLEGRRLRYAFGPRPGWKLAVADYNQIELRILAHLSQDKGLLAAFESGTDVHRAIAATVFGIEPDDVSHEQRETAKAVSYGLAYGMEAFGLGQRLGIDVGQAKSIMDKYFSGFPSLRAYMDDTVKEIRQRGYSRTEFGRIRPFPDLATATGPQRAAAERQAMNAGIQGLAADIFKSALVRLDHSLATHGLEARLVLQVHDEVLVEAPPSESSVVESLVLEALTGAAALSVPLEVSLHWGENWAEAKS